MMLRLTSLQGESVLVTGDDLIVHHAPKGTAAVNDCSLVQSSAGQVYVRETVDQIAESIAKFNDGATRN
jgi:hypothetical protein